MAQHSDNIQPTHQPTEVLPYAQNSIENDVNFFFYLYSPCLIDVNVGMSSSAKKLRLEKKNAKFFRMEITDSTTEVLLHFLC